MKRNNHRKYWIFQLVWPLKPVLNSTSQADSSSNIVHKCKIRKEKNLMNHIYICLLFLHSMRVCVHSIWCMITRLLFVKMIEFYVNWNGYYGFLCVRKKHCETILLNAYGMETVFSILFGKLLSVWLCLHRHTVHLKWTTCTTYIRKRQRQEFGEFGFCARHTPLMSID